MPSLGEILAQRQRDDKARELAEVEARLAAEEAERKRKEKIVTDYFDNVRGTIESVLTTNGKMPVFTIGKRGGWVCDSYDLGSVMETFRSEFLTNVENPNNFYSPIWLAFKSWANRNDLDATLEYAHDMASQSWYEVVIKPKAGL